MLERIIPSSGEKIPVIGMGTWQSLNISGAGALQNAARVVEAWAGAGGRLIDSSPMYGKAEEVIGRITEGQPFADTLFYATKVWTTGAEEGIAQMEDSFRKMKRQKIDLLQIHNLVDWKTHLPQLRRWKEEGRIRYIGITHYTDASHEELRRIIEQEPLDFVQFNYSLLNRHAEQFLLPATQDKGVATLINRPFGEGRLLQLLAGKKLPEWVTAQGIQSWPDCILRYIVAHPAVTCVIPATSVPEHALNNAQAGKGYIPDEAFCKRLVTYIKEVL